MSARCAYCNTPLTLARPQVGDQEAVGRCSHCGKIWVLDSQPSAPIAPAKSETVWQAEQAFPAMAFIELRRVSNWAAGLTLPN